MPRDGPAGLRSSPLPARNAHATIPSSSPELRSQRHRRTERIQTVAVAAKGVDCNRSGGRNRSKLAAEAAAAVELRFDAILAQRKPERRRVDRDDRLAEDRLHSIRDGNKREVGAALHDAIDVVAVHLPQRRLRHLLGDVRNLDGADAFEAVDARALEANLLEELGDLLVHDRHVRRDAGDPLGAKLFERVLARLRTGGDAQVGAVLDVLAELDVALPAAVKRLRTHAHHEVLGLSSHAAVDRVVDLDAQLAQELHQLVVGRPLRLPDQNVPLPRHGAHVWRVWKGFAQGEGRVRVGVSGFGV
mmetsp:Transcript_46924/g.123635  ORF Transcript_46924/g.123635 Transcript_46924/m.123635 type:complete len:303 (-) Transcript_46924:624-1532(-)